MILEVHSTSGSIFKSQGRDAEEGAATAFLEDRLHAALAAGT